MARLSEKVDPCAVLPLWALYSDIVRWHHGPLDAPVCGPHKSYGDPTLDLSARPRVGMPTLFCEAYGYHFQGINRLQTQLLINEGDEQQNLLTFLDAYIYIKRLFDQRIFFLLHIRLLKG